jgi:hypothetical protein
VGVLLEILLELLVQLVGEFLVEILVEILFGVGEAATHGRTKRVLVFAASGAAAGLGSHFVLPRLLLPDPLTRYAVIAGLALGAGLFLAIIERRISGGARGAATAGFLSGVAFSLAYVGVRRLLL